MRSARTIIIALLLLVSGCASGGADKKVPDPCGGAVQCHGMSDQNRGGGGVGGGMM